MIFKTLFFSKVGKNVIDNLNFRLCFYIVRATSESLAWHISFAKFVAEYLINIVPILAIILCLCGPNSRIVTQRQLVFKALIALAVSLFISWSLGKIFPYDRPFVYKNNLGFNNCNYLCHAADNSFPSNHGTIIFTFALSFLFWHRLWSGVILLNIAVAIAWSRLYLGVHWPIDMIGSLIVGFISCLITHISWNLYGLTFFHKFNKVFSLLSFLFIRKRKVHN